MLLSRVLSRLLGAALALHRATLRVGFLHRDRYEALLSRGEPILFTLWHGRMFVPIQVHRGEGVITMASRSKDGEIIAGWLERHGFLVARGSSSRGAGSAFRKMVRAVRAGHSAALTVDGPRGPARVVQPGGVELARLTGAWILPVTFSSTPSRFLASWDRYLIPLPFSRCIVAYAEPFQVPPGANPQDATRRIASALDEATREADDRLGVTPPDIWRTPREQVTGDR